MKQIKSINDLKEGTKLLWYLNEHYAKKYGKVCIAEVLQVEPEIYIKFPERVEKVRQKMDLHSIKVNAQIITPEEDPEFFLWLF